MNFKLNHKFFLTSFCFLMSAMLLLSCEQKKTIDLPGLWTSSTTYEQEFYEDEKSDIPIAMVQRVQDNSFTFNSDFSYFRVIHEYVTKTQSFSSDISDEELAESYKDFDVEVTLSGFYSLKGNNLTLETKEIKLPDSDSSISYEEFFKTTPSYGEPILKTPITIESDSKIVIQGISFNRN